MNAYDFRGKSPDQLLDDFQTSTALAKRAGGDAYELGNLALAVHVANEQARAARGAQKWMRLSAISAVSSSLAAVAAVVVAASA